MRRPPEGTGDKAEARVGFLCGVCGCMPASLVFVVALGWQVTAFLSSGAEWISIRPQGIAAGIAMAVALALVTKLAAIALARSVVFLELARLSSQARRLGNTLSGVRHE